MTEASVALIERTERLLRQAGLDRTLGQLAALERLLSDTSLAAAPRRRVVQHAPSDAAYPNQSSVDASLGEQSLAVAAAAMPAAPVPSVGTPSAAQPEYPMSLAQRISVAAEPALSVPRRALVTPLRLATAAQTIAAVAPSVPDESPSPIPAGPPIGAPRPSAPPAQHGVERQRGRPPMVTLAAPGVLSSDARATPLGTAPGGTASPPRRPPVEVAPPPNGAPAAAESAAPLEVAWPTLPIDGRTQQSSGSSNPQATPPRALQPRSTDFAAAPMTQTPADNDTISQSVPGADLRWLADRLERLLRDEARAHGISV